MMKVGALLTTVAIIFLFCISASSLLVLNKECLKIFACPFQLLLLQTIFSCAVSLVCCIMDGTLSRLVEPSVLSKTVVVVVLFFTSIVSGMCVLHASSVPFVIVLHTIQPAIVGVAEYLFLNREFPRGRNIALFSVLGFATFFIFRQNLEPVRPLAVVWAVIWFSTSIVNHVYARHYATSNLTGQISVMGKIFLNNGLSSVLLIPSSFILGESCITKLAIQSMPHYDVVIIALSCIFGVSIAWTGWELRYRVSAMSYTVLSVANKLISVGLNQILNHGSLSSRGIALLAVVVVGSCFYVEEPVRLEKKSATSVDRDLLDPSKLCK